jgi:hypothetical protein
LLPVAKESSMQGVSGLDERAWSREGGAKEREKERSGQVGSSLEVMTV